MNNKLDVNKIMKVTTLPKIFSQLEIVGEEIDKEIEKINKMQFNEEAKQEAKNIRADINKTLQIFEDRRKQIKNEILKDYVQFNEKYEIEVKDKLTNASELLGNKIDEIETKQKEEKETKLREFFKQYQETYHLEDVVKFEDVGLNITLSASEKSLKDEIVVFCEKINKDIQVINNEENKEELMLEYMNNGFDYQDAKLTLYERKKRLEELKNKQQEVANVVEQEQKVEEVIDLTGAPQEVINEEEMLEVTFTIIASKSQLKELKQWLEERNINYA